jgi:(p)ppGpp synthase/HD superfamily hydrolase
MVHKPAHKTKPPKGKTFSKKFVSALCYAADLHAKQFRKRTGRPYIGHLLGVTSITVEYGGDEEMAIAALLHDAVEDQGGLPRLREIRRKFGKRAKAAMDGTQTSLHCARSKRIGGGLSRFCGRQARQRARDSA